jgi:hypothetical protein
LTKPSAIVFNNDKAQKVRHEWTFGIIYNRHCCIYCTLDNPTLVAAEGDAVGMKVYIEDDSGKSTALPRMKSDSTFGGWNLSRQSTNSSQKDSFQTRYK